MPSSEVISCVCILNQILFKNGTELQKAGKKEVFQKAGAKEFAIFNYYLIMI